MELKLFRLKLTCLLLSFFFLWSELVSYYNVCIVCISVHISFCRWLKTIKSEWKLIYGIEKYEFGFDLNIFYSLYIIISFDLLNNTRKWPAVIRCQIFLEDSNVNGWKQLKMMRDHRRHHRLCRRQAPMKMDTNLFTLPEMKLACIYQSENDSIHCKCIMLSV